MKKIIPLAVMALALGLVGCGSSGSEPVSEECTAAVQKLKVEADRIYATATADTPGDVLNAPEVYPLESCSSFDEYSKAGIDNPEAWGMTRNSEEDMERIVLSACRAVDEQSSTPVCSDAKELGLLGN